MPFSQRPLRILIPGGTSRLGMLLARYLHQQGHVVSTITRFPKPHPWESIHWDSQTVGDWASSLEGADAVVHLAARYPRTTKVLAEAITQCRHPPPVLLTCSSYFDPANGISQALAIRHIELRLCPVQSPGLPPFSTLLRLVRWGVGGEIGSGDQYISWIHDLDFMHAIEFMINRQNMEGIVNLASPQPLPNHEYMADLRDAWSANHFGLPVPGILAKAFSRQSKWLLKDHRVIPQELLGAGFTFEYPAWQEASVDLVRRWRQQHEP